MKCLFLHKRQLVVLGALVIPFGVALCLGSTQAQPPDFPRPPGFGGPGGLPPRPGAGAFGNPAGPGVPNMPTPPFGRPERPGSLFEHVFTCSNCRRELGRSDHAFDKPPYDKCPHCGVEFINSGRGFSRPGNSFRPNEGGQHPAQPPAPGGPNLGGGAPPVDPPDPIGGFGDNQGGFGPPLNPVQNSDPPPPHAPGVREAKQVGALLVPIIALSVVAFVGLLVIGGVIFLVVALSRSGKSQGKARRLYADERDQLLEEGARSGSRTKGKSRNTWDR